jgi:hypothetical protein
MLTADQLDALTEEIVDLYEKYQVSVLRDIARRLAGLDYATETAAWQVQRLTESGKVYEEILSRLAQTTGQSEQTLRSMFEKAGVRALKFDDAIYRDAGLQPLPLNLSPAMAQVLAAGLAKTGGMVRNLTMTTALSGQEAFIQAADLAYMQITGGAMDYQSALKAGIRQVASEGLTVIHFSGRREQLDVALRRAVLTGVGQTTGELQIARADEMGADLVQTSAHAGARNTGTGPANHESWQGKIFSRSGRPGKYPDFVSTTGYGTGPGLCGWNCVVGDTLVSGPAIRAAYRREYSGEIIVIRTAGGHELTVTPNHPILTDKGWVAAGLLAEGDNVISRAGLNGVGSSCPNPDQNETRIEDIFDSISQSGDVIRLPAPAGYFHGDVSDSEIDVVFPKGFLRNGLNPPFSQKVGQFSLGDTVELSGAFVSESTLRKVFIGSSFAPNGVMGGFHEFRTPFFPGSFQSGTHSIGPAFRERDAQFGKVSADQTFRDADLRCNFVLPETGIVQAQEFIRCNARLSPQVHGPVSGIGDAVSLDAVLDGVERTPVPVGDGLERLAGHEAVDNIVFVERKSSQGSFVHVYNLETEGGWYFANGIITHNCRHSFYPFFPGISARHYDALKLDELASRKVTYNGEEMSVYDATQKQRSIERQIRKAKRQAAAVDAAGLDNSAELARVRIYQAKMRSFINQTGLQRQRFREQIFERV